MDGNNVSLKRDKTFSFICSFHTPLVSEVQLNECGDQQWGLWGGGCTEGTVCVFFFLFEGNMNDKNRTSSDVHLCLILKHEMSQRQFVEFLFLTDIYYFNSTYSS